MISDRPETLHRNASRQLHNEKGPSVAYRDGWKLWHIDGVAVDEQIILRPESQTISEIECEKNQDVRSIRIARFGWTRYLRESGAKQIDMRRNEIEGTIEALYHAKNGQRRLVATCPTGRVFTMGVPDDVKTCEEAQAYLAGGRPFRVLART